MPSPICCTSAPLRPIARSATALTDTRLAGMPREALLAQLQAFKAGTRPSTIMGQIAKGYSEAQLEQLAAWFAAQK